MSLHRTMNRPMNRIDLAAGPIEYQDVGSGPVVVFVHGLFADGALWREVVPLLPARRCIVPTWPLGSHRLAMRPGADLSPPGVAALVADFLAALDLRDVTLVGNDSGGAVCQLVAARYPERIGRLVLTNCDAFELFPPPAFAYLTWAPRIPGLMTALAKLLHGVPRLRRLPLAWGALTVTPIAEDLLDAWSAPGARDPAIRRDAAAFMRGADPRLTIEAAEALGRFARPVRLVWGARDRFFPVALAERLAAAIPGARLDVVDGAATFLPLDRPDALAAAIRDDDAALARGPAPSAPRPTA